MTDQAQSQQVWWTSLIKELGLPTAISIVLIFGVWNGAKWAASEIFQPMIVDQRETTKDLRATYKAQTEALLQISNEVKENGKKLIKLQEGVDSLLRK